VVSFSHFSPAFSFDLAEKFRLSTSPDFLLTTIGEGRSAIERAYDWLIPIISSHPAIIHRLKPSASCFLLLRAYGVEGDKNRELIGLTAPLLSHVTKSLTGR
jgi:integrator complex subunit 1